jgi:hypothetical protein
MRRDARKWVLIRKRIRDKDLTQVFKILKEIEKVEPEEIFTRRRVSQHTKQSANPWTLTS